MMVKLTAQDFQVVYGALVVCQMCSSIQENHDSYFAVSRKFFQQQEKESFSDIYEVIKFIKSTYDGVENGKMEKIY